MTPPPSPFTISFFLALYGVFNIVVITVLCALMFIVIKLAEKVFLDDE